MPQDGKKTVQFAPEVLERLDRYVKKHRPRGRRSGAVEQGVRLLLDLDEMGLRPDQFLARLRVSGDGFHVGGKPHG